MRLLNVLQQHADNGRASMPVGRWGTVTSGDTNSMTVKVLLQPEGVLTDWLPLASSVVGGGWGLVHVPPVGTQVFCVPDAGDDNSYVVVGATWSTGARPPSGVLQGELWLVHSTGSQIKLTNDGHILLQDHAGSQVNLTNDGHMKLTDPSGCSLEFNNNGTALLTGDLFVTGNITDVNGLHGALAAFRAAYMAHHHTNVQTGAGSTGLTDHPI